MESKADEASISQQNTPGLPFSDGVQEMGQAYKKKLLDKIHLSKAEKKGIVGNDEIKAGLFNIIKHIGSLPADL